MRHPLLPSGKAIPKGEVFALDRDLPCSKMLMTLARFRGQSKKWTRWLTKSVSPRLTDFAVRRWQVSPATILDSSVPFALSVTSGNVRDGISLLLAEWMEYRRLEPRNIWRLVMQMNGLRSGRSSFEIVSPFWEQIQAIKRQLRVETSGIYLWISDEPSLEGILLDTAEAIINVSGERSDLIRLAQRKGKRVIAPQLAELEGYGFATRPAVIRFVGEVRNRENASSAWPICEPLALAHAIQKATSRGNLLPVTCPRLAA